MHVFFVFFVVIGTVALIPAQNTVQDIKLLVSDKSTLLNDNPNAGYYESDNAISNNRRNERFSYLHAIEEELLHQNWTDQEKPCLNQLVKFIRNVQNFTLWATWIWDSMEIPMGQLYGKRNHLGHFDQCLNMPWKDQPEYRTQYCLAEINLSDVDPEITDVDPYSPVQNFVRLKTKYGLTYNNLVWGICAPVVCKQESVAKFASAMFRLTHLGPMNQHHVEVNSEHCQIAGKFQDNRFYEHMFSSLIIFLVIITLICTWYVRSTGAECTSNFAKAFDIKSNAQWLMKVEDKSLRSVHGIRVVTSYFVAAGHLWLTKNVFGVANAGEIDKQWNESSSIGMFNVDITVDIFFMISGLLLVKSVVQKMKPFNPFIIITRRYVRLTCSLVLILLMVPIVYFTGVTGPLVKKYLGAELELWKANWWRSILMIGNYGESENIAYVVLWSLACDFHLFIIGILICWVYVKNRSTGIKLYAVCAAASIITPVIHGYFNNSGAVISFNFRISDNFRENLIGDPAYVRSHLRAGPYFVGLAGGYLMASFPAHNYRNVMSRKSSVFALLVLVSSFASLYYWSGTYHGREYGPLEGAMFAVMRRNVFAALIAFLVILCEYGSLPLISKPLSLSVWVPLSKLTYGVYLTHSLFIFRFVAMSRVPLWSHYVGDLYSTFSMVAMSYTLSLLMWLFWEAPFINLFDCMVCKRFADKNQTNGNIEDDKSTIKTLHIEEYEENAERELKKKIC